MSKLTKSVNLCLAVTIMLFIKINANKSKEKWSNLIFEERSLQNRRGTISDNRRGLVVKNTEDFWEEYWKQYGENILNNPPQIERRGKVK